MKNSDSSKKTILILVGHYIPAFKAGGVIRSIEGFVDAFSEDYNIKIVTRDRDLNDEKPFDNIQLNSWVKVGNAKIFYIKKSVFNCMNIYKILRQTDYDLVYINSFFCRLMSMFPIILRALHLAPCKPMVLAPRGEFSPGALKIKYLRKKTYIKIFGKLYMKSNIYWQASSHYEKMDIIHVFNKITRERIFVAGDLSKNSTIVDKRTTFQSSLREKRDLRLVFLSRISEKKNLDYALNILKKLKIGVQFDIYGPIEDQIYWQKCLELINKMPKNINVRYCGSISHDEVISTIQQYDIFFFPTLGENYGHVLEESIHAGVPILVSDQTPWRELEIKGIGCDISLSENHKFIDFINNYNELTYEKKKEIKENVIRHSIKILNNKELIEANKKMIENIFNLLNNAIVT